MTSLKRPSISLVVIALNEEKQLARCLESGKFADEIIVIDGASSDATVSIARSFGAKVFVYADWQGFGVQRSRALRHVTGDYILWLDADEQIDVQLAQSIQASSLSADVLMMRWRPVVFGRALSPYHETKWHLKLLRRQLVKEYQGLVHEGPVWATNPPRSYEKLNGRVLHYTRPSVSGSLVKIHQYALLGAKSRHQAGKRGGVLKGLFSALRVFILHFAFKGGFLNGGPGFLYAQSLALEAFFKYAILGYDDLGPKSQTQGSVTASRSDLP